MNGYEKPCPVGIEVRADNLEIAAGWPDEARVDKELRHALDTLDESDPASLRWLAVCIAAKLDYVDVRARLEYLRSLIRSEEGISYGELAELQGLADHIEPGDVELAEWAGIPEEEFAKRGGNP